MNPSDIPTTAGVYAWTNTINGKQYIGSSKNLRWRFYSHRRGFELGIHPNQKLRRAIAKYGFDAFTFFVVELVDSVVHLREREQYHIDALKPAYNILSQAYSPSGYKHSPEALERLRAAHSAPDVVANWVTKVAGQEKSPEHRAKISASNIGKHSHENWTDEQRAAASERARRLGTDPDTIERSRQARIGGKRTAATKERMAQARRAWWARKHAETNSGN